jgi:hypothetical protein
MSTEPRRFTVRPGGRGKAPVLVKEDIVNQLKPERIQEWLQAFPAWRLGPTGNTLHRAKAFPTAEVAAQYGAFAAGLAGALGLPVRVSLVDGQASLLLHAGRQRGRYAPLTEAVLAFAAQIG